MIVAVVEQTVQQGCFAGTQKSGKDGDGQAGVGRSIGRCI
jgi:hypothetical protein